MYYIYVLRSIGTGFIYKGFTSNLNKRFKEHNSKQVKSTKTHAPFELIYFEEHKEEKVARRREIFLKSGKGRQVLKNIFGQNLEGMPATKTSAGSPEI